MIEYRELDLCWIVLSTGVTLDMSPHARPLSRGEVMQKYLSLGLFCASHGLVL